MTANGTNTPTAADTDSQPARFYWLPPGLRPAAPMTRREERIFLLVGMAALFAGFDQNVYGFALPQIQAALHIPENQIGPTVTYFRLATFVAMLLALTADIVGRRRLLLFTVFGQAAFTLATAFSQTYPQFVWFQVLTRIFGYAEEMLCIVVIVEEVAASLRGWSAGTLSALTYTGAGLASLCFGFVNVLPGHWRALYVIGGCSMFFVAFLRRRLPETKRFEVRHAEVERLHARIGGALDLFRRIMKEYPGRIALLLIIAGAWGFAIGPATVLQNKYLQTSLHFLPWQTTLLSVPGGLLALWLNILMGRASDRIGRRLSLFIMMIVCGLGYTAFYSGLPGIYAAPLWILSFFAFFSADALLAALTIEIVPTAYRATVGGLRYMVEIFLGGVSLYLEGHWYDVFHDHGPAISVSLAAIVVALVAIFFVPEPAGKVLEDISHG
ncbi:MAG: MFS transporter [Alphaproteobacteria bacterium]|nr:MFS transporter [Alphaproteobacteria bacterium]